MNIAQLFENHDFTETTTGGNCMAYRNDIEGGYHILITDWEGCGLPETLDEKCCVGLYSEDGETQLIWDCDDVYDALYQAKFGVSEHFAELEASEQS